MAQFFIGVDGGGTSCRVALSNDRGIVIGRSVGGSANILTDMEGAIANITKAARSACLSAGVDFEVLSHCGAVLGLAGANIATVAAEVSRRLPFYQCSIETDACIAVHGALGAGDGVVAILGTGSVFSSKRGEAVHSIGGWGFAVGDQASGAWLGRRLLEDVLLANDGVRKGSQLTRDTLADFGNSPEMLVEAAKSFVPGDYAAFAPRIFEMARDGDCVAFELLRAGSGAIEQALGVLMRDGDDLCLLGGLGVPYHPWLSVDIQARIKKPVGDALNGASQMAIDRFSYVGDVHA